jgi:hypothetical protein
MLLGYVPPITSLQLSPMVRPDRMACGHLCAGTMRRDGLSLRDSKRPLNLRLQESILYTSTVKKP